MGEPGAPRRIKRTQPAAELGVREHGEFPSTGSVGLYWRLSNMVGKFLHRKKKSVVIYFSYGQANLDPESLYFKPQFALFFNRTGADDFLGAVGH